MHRILFICKGSSGRSLMAAAFARKIAPDTVEIYAASLERETNIPVALSVMDEVGLEIPKSTIPISDLSSLRFEVVITVCVQMQLENPQFPGSPARVHWGLSDPQMVVRGDEKDLLAQFRMVRNEIRDRVRIFFEQGYFEAIAELQVTYGRLLNAMTDGVVAHDKKRKIFFFNRAAEEITGLDASEVIGKDCHEIMPGQFCGKDCELCMKNPDIDFRADIPIEYTRRDGAMRTLRMSIMPVVDAEDHRTGALIMLRDMTEMNQLRARLEDSRGFQGIIGLHPSMTKVYHNLREVAKVNVPILIEGESGTGKELVAQAIHRLSSRANRPFVPVNCGALPEGTLESELFGHVKGAFTSAIRDKKGRFELADGGILFLDEIGEISPNLQVKLLRVLQEKNFERVGGEEQVNVDVMVICATNRNLKSLTDAGTFRQDLYYRLAVVPMRVPPLRDRKTDIPLLIEHFEDQFAAENSMQRGGISNEALNALMHYPWPGNVRELANAIHYAMIKSQGTEIQVHHLAPEIVTLNEMKYAKRRGRRPKLNASQVERALKEAGGNKAKAADYLGVSRTTLYRYLEELQV
jgi:sigma-54 dependent transcriptional regulator, acetoin dehydrogenase operon transcriptional activator AcoR